jgi:hypothetical protein
MHFVLDATRDRASISSNSAKIGGRHKSMVIAADISGRMKAII